MSELRFKIIGEHLGYPACCIQWFEDRIKGFVNFSLTPDQEAVHQCNGFIPCPSCATKLNNTDLNITDLIKNRRHPFPYPESDSEILSELIIKSL